jgi:hypothetical protein
MENTVVFRCAAGDKRAACYRAHIVVRFELTSWRRTAAIVASWLQRAQKYHREGRTDSSPATMSSHGRPASSMMARLSPTRLAVPPA